MRRSRPSWCCWSSHFDKRAAGTGPAGRQVTIYRVNYGVPHMSARRKKSTFLFATATLRPRTTWSA